MSMPDHLRDLRLTHVCASEVAAVLGMHPFKSAYDIWLEKTGKVQQDDAGNEATELGHMIEAPLLDWGAGKLGVTIIKNQFRVLEGTVMAATHDALVNEVQDGIEAKTAGIVNPWGVKKYKAQDEDDGAGDMAGWGEPGTDQIPQHYFIQGQTQALVSRLNVVHVAALIAGRGRVLYRIEPDTGLASIIIEKCSAFWVDCVQSDIPPSDSLPSIDLGRARQRTPGKIILLPTGVGVAYSVAKAREKEAKEASEMAERSVLAALGDAEGGRTEDGGVCIKIVGEQAAGLMLRRCAQTTSRPRTHAPAPRISPTRGR